MPTLIRLLVVGGVLVALAIGVMTAMVTYFQPAQRDMSQPVSLPGR